MALQSHYTDNNNNSTRLWSFHDGFLRGLFFDPEDGGDMKLRNVGWLSMY
jgi:hypothetical protein